MNCTIVEIVGQSNAKVHVFDFNRQVITSHREGIYEEEPLSVKIQTQICTSFSQSMFLSSTHRNPLTDVLYTVDFNGGDPDPFFINEPSEEDIANATKEATGLDVCQKDCNPAQCQEIRLQVISAFFCKSILCYKVMKLKKINQFIKGMTLFH